MCDRQRAEQLQVLSPGHLTADHQACCTIQLWVVPGLPKHEETNMQAGGRMTGTSMLKQHPGWCLHTAPGARMHEQALTSGSGSVSWLMGTAELASGCVLAGGGPAMQSPLASAAQMLCRSTRQGLLETSITACWYGVSTCTTTASGWAGEGLDLVPFDLVHWLS